MFNLLFVLLLTFFSVFKNRRDLGLEVLALRQQLAVYKRQQPRPQLKHTDRLFWVWLSKIWSGWRQSLIIVRPETARRLASQGIQAVLEQNLSAKECWSTSRESRSKSSDQADGGS